MPASATTCQPLRTMMAATRIESRGSIGVQPVSRITAPAASAATEPSRSPSTWTAAPRMLRLSRSAPCSSTEGGDVDEQPERGDDHHDAAGDLRRGHQPLDRLIDDPGGDGEQRKPVGERDQHLEAVEAVSAPPVGGTPRQAEPEPGERERGEVGEHVAGVGEQRERAGGDAARHLGEHEGAGEQRGEPHAPLVIGVGARRGCGRHDRDDANAIRASCLTPRSCAGRARRAPPRR